MSDFWNNLYSTATRQIKPSPIREMLHLIRKPGMISFAGGMPDPAVFPVKQFSSASRIIEERGRDILQYGVTEGYQPLKEFLCQWTAPRMGHHIEPQEMLITSGSSQASDLLSLTLLDRGDYVITEEATFLGNALDMYNHGAGFLTVPMDNEGMKVDLLPGIIEKARSEGKKIKYIYTIPTFHNPCGTTMSLERRKKLVEIAQNYGLPIFEDDPYGYVRFEGEDLPTLFSLDDRGIVLYAGSFSKILAPGTRVAWCVGDPDLIHSMTVFKQGVDTCTSVVAQALVYEYCRQGHLDAFLPRIIEHYHDKRNLMEEAFRKYLPSGEVDYVTPKGGFFYWLHTPNISAGELFRKALDKNVAFVEGAPFYPNGGGEHHFRMCYTFASPEAMDEGIKRLGEAMRELL